MQYVNMGILALMIALLALPVAAAEKQAETWNTCKEISDLRVRCIPRDATKVVCSMGNSATMELVTATWRLRGLGGEEEVVNEAELQTAAFTIQARSPWGIMEAAYPCGNGTILWRALVSRVNGPVQLEPYSEQSLRELGLWSKETAINLAIFRGVQNIERPSEEVPERIKRKWRKEDRQNQQPPRK